jgi:hypothetical protein
MDLTQQPKESNEWDLHYKKIKQLFITEKLPLSKVMTIMEREHKFRATYVLTLPVIQRLIFS